MRKIYFFVSLFIALFVFSSAVSAAVTYCSPSAFGYSTATGGGSATPVLVSSVSDLQKALNKGKNKVIIITANLTFTSMLSVQDGENVTLLGLPGVTLTSLQQTSSSSGILFVKRFKNLIIRNLTFVGPGAYDCDGNDLLCFENVTNAWVDHCDFQDGCDGNFDNKHNTDNVTVSWCRFRYLKTPTPGGSGGSDDHRFTNLLGSSSSDAPSDGTYNFTWAYCWWDEGCKERMVRCRNAELHFLNCYWNSSVANYYVGPENAKAYFEGCTFEGKANTKKAIFKSYGGTNACKFIDCSGNLPSASGSVSAPEYIYTAYGRAEAKTAVTNTACGAGATLTVTPTGGISSTCDGGAAPVPTIQITWDAATNGGTCATAYSIVESGSEIGSLPTAEKSGSSFEGWFTSATGGDQITSSTIFSANTTCYAHFNKISGGGGACIEWAGVPSTLTDNAIIVDTDLKLTAGNSTSLTSDKVWDGSGGSKTLFKINGTNQYIEGRFTDGSGISSVTISAANNQDAGVSRKYVVVFSPNSDFTSPSAITVYEYAAPSCKDARDDSKLIHEFYAPEGTMYFRIYRRFTVGGTYGDNQQIRVYGIDVCKGPAAVPTVPTLFYDENGGSGTMDATEGPNVTIAANGFAAPEGYAFQAWNTNGNGQGTAYAPGAALTLTEDLTLYAIWQPQTYTVSLQANGGTGGTTAVSATFDEAMPDIAIPTRSGYVFLGYYTGTSGTGTQYYDGNGSSTNNWTIASNTTLHANWEEESSSTPDTGCDLRFWFPNVADAETNGVQQNEIIEGIYVFTSMTTTKSTMAGSITIDGKSFSTTTRTGDVATFGQFQIPNDKTGIFYALAVSSGAGDRQINLVRGSTVYELPVEGGSSSYKRIESEVLPAGTYSIQRNGNSNVRIGVIVVKLCDTEVPSTDKTVYLDVSKCAADWAKGDERYAVYGFNSSGEKWYDMTPVSDGCGGTIYKADVSLDYTTLIFCRMNGGTTENKWDNKWDQTGNLTAADGEYCVITSSSSGTATCTWSHQPFQICVTGTWLRFTGEDITLNATCSGATYFQWYKDGVAIDGAIEATYTKGSCTMADAGNYTCKAWRVAGQEVTSDPIGVKVPYLNIKTGRWGSEADLQRIALIRADEEAEMASGSLHLGVGWDYGFFISDGFENHGQNNGDYYLTDKLNSDNCTDWDRWIMNDLSNRCVMRSTKEGTYTFTIKFSKDSWNPIKVNVTYPPMVQTAGIPIFMEKTAAMEADEWNKIYYRIGKGNQVDGNEENWTKAFEMTLVPGTARYYQTTTDDWGNNFWAWHIGNNRGNAGSPSSIYKTNSDDGSKEITRSINFSGDEILAPGWTIYLAGAGSWGGDGKNDHCQFFPYTHTDGMLTHNISIGATDHGKIKVEYIHHDGSSQISEENTARTLSDLAHTCILKITAVPDCGYEIKTLKINGEDFTSGTDYILASDGKTVTASFTYATYDVTLHTNGGTIKPGEEVTGYTYPIGVTLPAEITYSGHEFLGWFDNEGCTGDPVTLIPDGDCGNKEFWAKWVLGKPSPVFTWNGETTLKAGGIYPISVATTGNADVTLSIKEGSITGVTPDFTAGKPASGTVTIGSYPAATSFTYQAESPETSEYKAKTEDKTITIERCETPYELAYGVGYNSTSSPTKPNYYHETPGIGRITMGNGGSTNAGTSASWPGESWIIKSTSNSAHLLQTYLDGVNKIEYFVNAGGTGVTLNKLRRSNAYISGEGQGEDGLPGTTIIYNNNPSQTSLTKGQQEILTVIFTEPLQKNDFVYLKLSASSLCYGVKLYRPEGDVETSIAFDGELTIEKYPGDAAFTKIATQTTTPTLSAGSITYKSSDETVATVDKNTGVVSPLNVGHVTITATLNAIGCFKAATATYSLTVKKCIDPACTIAVTTGKANKCSSESVTLTATAAAGATFQWFKDGVVISGENNPTLTTTEAGEYYATATRECLQKSNTIEVVNLSAPTATALHDYYYIKAGRVTPPIKLFQISNASSWIVSPAAPAGCAYELGENGIIYLTGIPSSSLAAGTQDITVTASNTCGFSSAPATLELRSLEATTKPQIAWIGCKGDGKNQQALPGTIDASQSTDHALYRYLTGSATSDDPSDDYFELTPVNAYCTIDPQKISDYYSQFDLILLTDYPDTHVCPTGDIDPNTGENYKKENANSYSNAIGSLIDEKPILTFEAFVAGLPNWGINTEPKTPSSKQKDMTLLCSAHKIFEHTTITDEVVEFLSTTDGAGNALQGFTTIEVPAGMIFIATIKDGSKNLIVCCERQKVIEARMMIMGLNHDAMGKVSSDGKTIIKQIIEYLLQFKDIADCSIVFDNGAGNNDFNPGTYTGTGTKGDGLWSTAANWYPAYNAVPNAEQAVRVDKPCNVNVTNAHCSSIRLRKDGEWDGKLTIQPNGGLTVIDGITEVHGTNFMTTYPSKAADLVIKAGDQPGEYGQNGSLVFGNTEEDLQATVEYYSLAKDAKTSSPVWQYIGIPITDRPMAIDAYHAAWMCSWESEGTVSSNWVWVENEDRIQPFKGYCITQQAAKKYTHIGSLSRPETKDLPLYYFDSEDGPGFNMFANSWVAPIDISKIEAEDFNSAAEATIFIYNTGSREQYDGGGTPSTTGVNTGAGQFNAIPVNSAPYMTDALTKIPTMQGFFVQATKEGLLTLDYKKICFDDKDFQTTAETMRAPKRRAEDSNVEKIVPEVMRLDVVSANWGDRLYILTHEEFSDAFDRGWDGSKQEGDAEAPMLALVRGNGLLAVAAIETAEERELSFRAGEDTEYTFHFNYEGETIYLYDRLADQAVEIKTGNTYSFMAENKTPAKRFIITKNPPRIPTDIENTTSGSQYSDAEKCIIDGQLYIIKNNRFYDARGVRVNSFKRKEVTP